MTKKAKYGSVKVVDRSGKLYLDFRFNGHRFRPALDLVNNLQNHRHALALASRIELDIFANEFDRTLIKYLGDKKTEGTIGEARDKQLIGMYAYWQGLKELQGNDYEGVYRFIKRAAPNWNNLQAAVSAQNWSTTTHNRYCKILNTFIQWANTQIDKDVKELKLVKGTKQKDPKRKPFTLDEMQAICSQFKAFYVYAQGSHSQCENYYYLVLFLFATGCRMGEIVGLKAKHFNLANGTVEISESLSPKSAYDSARIQKSTKTGSVRVLPLPDFLLEIFSRILAGKKPDEYVFLGPQGEPVNQKNFTRRIWPVVLNGLGIEYRVPYAGRHTVASMAIEQGIPLTGIAYLMGHSDTTMVMKQYGHMINRPNLPDIDLTA
ncbi:site-specific integrase [Leptolyngbya sp. KIOST-1]|uniref:site-specific integrase n=1 Tax=Leptolyngbya sp. KIOST-1 TaxID=1229172 RepID=UPI00068ADEAC|nr:site-specific integrase [Leptolyngbya sp. KIOST-1]